MLARIKINFYMTGDCVDLDDLTKKLSIQPLDKRKKNEWPKPSVLAGIAKDVWEFQIKENESRSVDLQFEKLQKILYPKIDIINKLSEKYSLRINVAIIIKTNSENIPELVLSKENINFLSLINAEVGFDLYID